MSCGAPPVPPGSDESSKHKVFCVKFQREMPGLDEPPFDTELGRKIYENVSAEAWRMWGEHCKMILNEYRHLLLASGLLGALISDPGEVQRPVEELVDQLEQFEFLEQLHRAVGQGLAADVFPEVLLGGDDHEAQLAQAHALGGSDPSITIPTVRITLADGNTIKSQLGVGVNVTLGVDMSLRAGADVAGKAILNAPDPVQPGSSISHWDPIAFPNQLMEPAINGDLTHNVAPPYDLTLPLLRDVGWYPDADLDLVPDDGADQCLGSDLRPTVRPTK